MQTRPGVLALFSFLVFALFLSGQAAAEAYYVATAGLGGSDDNDGLRPTRRGQGEGPWLTIQHAVDSVTPGDTILVRGGRYGEQITIATSSIQLRAFHGESPLIDGECRKSYGFRGAGDEALEDVLIEGFEITCRRLLGGTRAQRG